MKKKSNYKGYLNCEFAPNKGYNIVYSDTILYYLIKKNCILNVLQGKKFATWSFTVSLPIEEDIKMGFQTS